MAGLDLEDGVDGDDVLCLGLDEDHMTPLRILQDSSDIDTVGDALLRKAGKLLGDFEVVKAHHDSREATTVVLFSQNQEDVLTQPSEETFGVFTAFQQPEQIVRGTSATYTKPACHAIEINSKGGTQRAAHNVYMALRTF